MAEPTLSNALPTVAAHNIKSENCEGNNALVVEDAPAKLLKVN
jgi:hypothetical protein